ncbi:ESX secretion-associated protein EspG [Amycolatopsis sp. NPDC049868]|uniref:ESX secretion-associated protein EspG n=1 Tax=Amycolatopsis sp. NPDC049868 TaxID=3363934 RepID=UPI0037AFD5BA
MPASFSMSMAQLDVVLEELGLGRFVLPFEIPTVGTTITERERHCEEIWAGLADRGFARGRELLRDYEQTLRLWATGDFVVTMEAHEVEQDAEYLYRGAWNSRLGVVSQQRGFDILFEPVFPEQVVATLLGYLPSLQPFPGRVTTSSTLPPAKRPDDPFDEDPNNLRLGAAARFFEHPLARLGTVSVTLRDDRGKPQQKSVQWFDSLQGRFMLTTDRFPDGEVRRTFTPTSGSHLARWVHDLVEAARVGSA